MEKELRLLIKALNPEIPVNWEVNPENSGYPAVVLNLLSSVNGHHMAGPDELRTDRVQIDVYATDMESLVGVRDIIRSGVDGYVGDRIQGAFLSDISHAPENGKRRAKMTFFINHV